MPRTTIENTVVAYLDNDDSPDITNPIHSTEVAKSYGFDGPLVGGVTVGVGNGYYIGGSRRGLA